MSDNKINFLSGLPASCSMKPHKRKEHVCDCDEVTNDDCEEKNTLPQVFSETIKKVLEAFSQLVDFISSLSDTFSKLSSNKEELVPQLVKLINEAEEKISKDKSLNSNLSAKSKEALEKLSHSVNELEKRKELKDVDLRGLIAKWREEKHHKCLLEIAHRIKDGKDVKINNEKLKEIFIEGLESFAEALEEALTIPDQDKKRFISKTLTAGADLAVDGVERIHEKGGDNELTADDKKYIGEKLHEASNYAESLIYNPAFSNCGCGFERLFSWVTSAFDFLKEWFCEQEEEKKKEKELCEKRCEEKKEIIKFCHRMKEAKRKKERFYLLMEDIKSKILYLRQSKSELERNKAICNYAKDKHREMAISEDYNKEKEDEIKDSLPPSYVCDHIGVGNLELDLLC